MRQPDPRTSVVVRCVRVGRCGQLGAGGSVQPPTPRRYTAGKKKAPKEAIARKWRLEESAWKVRNQWADSGNYYDTEDVYRRAFEHDWLLAVNAHGLARFIQRNDDGDSDDGEDWDGDGVKDDEVDEVEL